MRLSVHPPAAVVTDPGTGNRSAAPSRTSGRRATSSDHHPDSGDALSAVLDGRQYPCADQFRQADLVDLRAEAAWGSFSNTATWLWLRRVRLCFELGALQERCWGRLLAPGAL